MYVLLWLSPLSILPLFYLVISLLLFPCLYAHLLSCRTHSCEHIYIGYGDDQDIFIFFMSFHYIFDIIFT